MNGCTRGDALFRGDCAVEIMEALLAAGLHRGVPLPEVMIASLAVVGRLTVLHHDRDFDRINQVYGEPATECSLSES